MIYFPSFYVHQIAYRIQSLYLYFNYFIKIVPFWLRNIRFLIQNTRSLFYGCHYSPLHRLMSLQRKLNVKIFLMFIVAENTGSVNITKCVSQYIAIIFFSNSTVYFSFNSCLEAIASPEGVDLSQLYPYKRSLYSHVCSYIILILFRKVQN